MRFEHEAGQRGALLKWYVSDTLADIDNDRLALAHVVLVDATRDVVLAELPDCQESCGDSRVGPLNGDADSGKYWLNPQIHGCRRYARHVLGGCRHMTERLTAWAAHNPRKSKGCRVAVAYRVGKERVMRPVAPPLRMSDAAWSDWLRVHSSEDGVIEATRGGALQRWMPYSDPADLPDTTPSPAQLRIKIISPDGAVWSGGGAYVTTTSRPRDAAAEWFASNGDAQAQREQLVEDAKRAGGRLVFVLPSHQAPKPSPVEQLRNEVAELRRQIAQLQR